MSKRDWLAASAAFIVLYHHQKEEKVKRRRKRRQFLRHREICAGSSLLKELDIGNVGQCENFCRISSEDFAHLLALIEPVIRKKETNYRSPIPPNERLAITLHFLATGDSYTSLMYLFQVSKQSISTIVIEVCRAINDVLRHFVKMPSTPEEWLRCAKEFEDVWDFPHCLAAMDGRHIMVQTPIQGGTEPRTDKSLSSIVLFALVDANYSFLFADVSAHGRVSDGGIFKNSELCNKIQENGLNIPEPAALPGRDQLSPYVLLADEAFTLHDNIMKPFSGIFKKGSKERIFNYRLARARRVVENAFGVLTSVFRVLRKPMLVEPDKAREIVLTTVHLHNFLRQSKESKHSYSPEGSFDTEQSNGRLLEGTWRSETNHGGMCTLKKIPRKSSANAQAIREEMAEYFATAGSIPWQDDHA